MCSGRPDAREPSRAAEDAHPRGRGHDGGHPERHRQEPLRGARAADQRRAAARSAPRRPCSPAPGRAWRGDAEHDGIEERRPEPRAARPRWRKTCAIGTRMRKRTKESAKSSARSPPRSSARPKATPARALDGLRPARERGPGLAGGGDLGERLLRAGRARKLSGSSTPFNTGSIQFLRGTSFCTSGEMRNSRKPGPADGDCP